MMHLFFLLIVFACTNANNLMLPRNFYYSFYSTCLKSLVDNFSEVRYIYSINFNLYFDIPIIRLGLSLRDITWFRLERSDALIVNSAGDDLETLLEGMSQEPIFNPRGITIVMAPRATRSIFKTAAKYHLSRLIVMVNVSDSVVNLYSYRPYRFENVNTPDTNFSLWGTCLQGVLKKKRHNFNLPFKWRNTTVTALNNFIPPYTICGRCTTNRGIEYEALEIIADRLNFKVVYARADTFDYWGSKTNGSYSHILGQLQRREGDMTVGVFHSKFEEHLDFDMSFTFMEDGTRWLVPQARVLPYWKRLGLIFTKEVYLSLFLSLLLMMVVCHILYNTSYSSSWVMLYQILLEYSIKRLPFTFRTTIMIWTGSCLILSTMFKSKLIDILSKNSYERQINTLADIVDSELQILIDHDIARFYDYHTKPEEAYVKKNYKYCIDPRICITRTAFIQDCVTVDFQRSNEFHLPNYIDSEGDILVHLFNTYIFPVHMHLFFVKGYPIFPQIDQLLMRIRSSGVIEHLYDNAGYNARLAMSKKSIFKAEVLGLEQMQIAFFIWILGVFCAVFVLVVELVFGRPWLRLM